MAVQYKDYYKVLGVSKSASQDEIRKAYRRLAREHHPDVAKDKKAAEAKFKEINEANEVLGDPEKRRRYDELGSQWEQGGFQQGPGAGRPGGGFGNGFGGDGFSDFFETFFGGGMPGGFSGGGAFPGGQGGARGARHPFAGRGRAVSRDLEAQVEVTLLEVLQGAKKRVSFRRSEGGGGASTETLEVRIPKGVAEGQKIRLAGKGEHGGDLLLKVSLVAHPDYAVDGFDLVRKVTIPAWKAVLGGEVEAETLEGTVRLKIPAGTQADRRFRLRGRGLWDREKERGDLYLEIKVRLPEELKDEERAAWEALGALDPESGSSPNSQ